MIIIVIDKEIFVDCKPFQSNKQNTDESRDNQSSNISINNIELSRRTV